jgi:hypothetical protein
MSRLLKIGQVAVIALVTCLSSYCTSPDKQTKIMALQADEVYLVDSYVRIASAHDLAAATPLKSESLFAALDSTIDSTRIANTIRALDQDPDRWILVYRTIEDSLERARNKQGAGGTQGVQGGQERSLEETGP